MVYIKLKVCFYLNGVTPLIEDFLGLGVLRAFSFSTIATVCRLEVVAGEASERCAVGTASEGFLADETFCDFCSDFALNWKTVDVEVEEPAVKLKTWDFWSFNVVIGDLKMFAVCICGLRSLVDLLAF